MIDLDVLQADLEDFKCQECALTGNFLELVAAHRAALACIARVEALHRPREDGWCTACSEANDLSGETQDYPCPTVRALAEPEGEPSE